MNEGQPIILCELYLKDEVSEPDDQGCRDSNQTNRIRLRKRMRNSTQLLMGKNRYKTDISRKSKEPRKKGGYWHETCF
jgi:hypothetical protein